MEAGPDEEIFELDEFAQAKDDETDDLGMYLAYHPNKDGYWYKEDELRDLNAILNDRFGPQDDETEDSDPILFTKEDVLSQATTGMMTVHEAIELFNFLNDEGFYGEPEDSGFEYGGGSIYSPGTDFDSDPFVQEKGREWSFEADGDVTETPDDSDTDGESDDAEERMFDAVASEIVDRQMPDLATA